MHFAYGSAGSPLNGIGSFVVITVEPFHDEKYCGRGAAETGEARAKPAVNAVPAFISWMAKKNEDVYRSHGPSS
jgi:hypothetical protein